MKNSLVSFICVAAAAATLFSCAKESNLKIGDKAPVKGIKVNVIAGDDLSKTYVEDGEIPVVKWSDGDMVAVLESMDGTFMGLAQSDPAVIDAGKASFATSLSWEAEGGSSYKYAAVYPAQAAVNYNDEYLLYLPEIQKLQGNNFADDADVLFSTVVDNGGARLADGSDVQFAFRRLGTVVRMTLNGIPAGENILRIKMTSPTYLAGSISYDPVTSSVDPMTAFDIAGSTTITLYSDIVATGSDVIWFRVLAGRDLGESGDWLDFEVITDKGIYNKSVDPCPELMFVDGGLTKFSVDLSGLAVEPLSAPYFEDFEDGADDWLFFDEDGDGLNWFISDISPHSGSYVLASESYDGNYGALSPDNLAFTPPIRLFSTENYLSFWVRARHTSYQEETYAVYLAEGTPLGETVVLMDETTFPAGDYAELGEDGVYQHYIIKIPDEYAGEVVCIGFRHFNCYDQYWFLLDDVEIMEAPPVIEYTPYESFLGSWQQGSAVWTISQIVAGKSYAITGIKGQGELPSVEAFYDKGTISVSEGDLGTDQTLTGVFYYGGYYLHYPYNGDPEVLFKGIIDDEGNLYLNAGTCTYGTFEMFLFMDNGTQSATTDLPVTLVPYVPVEDPNTYIYKETFEEGGTGWTFFDADGDGLIWNVSNSLDAISGEYSMNSRSWTSATQGIAPDNYAYSPAITLTSNNYLSFWVTADTSEDCAYCYEKYAIYITDAAPTDETPLPAGELLFEKIYSPEMPQDYLVETSYSDYQHFVIPIPAAYENSTVYIGFRHFDCEDQNYIVLDDIGIIEGDPVFDPIIYNSAKFKKSVGAKAPKAISGPEKPVAQPKNFSGDILASRKAR